MIINKAKNKIISRQEKICNNILTQALGLMFRHRQNLVMVFKEERTIGLHNWFVFFPTDVLILNQNKKIVEIKTDFKPFRFWKAKHKGKYLIELGLKNGLKSRYNLGEVLDLKR